MNRKNLTSAVLAGLAGVAGIAATAQAVNINPDGLGQVLIYPYYTVNAGKDTLLSVVNTSDEAKAVKVRFLEGQNTREVLDFNLYMSAYDVWAAALTMDNGVPTLKVNDTSCTVPYLYGDFGGSQAFLPYAMTDGGGEDLARAAEGHFEMIEMGTLIGASAAAATHGVGSPAHPADCASLVEAWTDPDNTVAGDEGYWLMNPLTDLEAPSSGLFGGAAIIDVESGYMVSYDARAINGFATDVVANDVLHAEPGDVFPNLNSGDVLDATVFLADGTVLASTGLTRGVDAVSFVFMHDTIMNEYITAETIGAMTEWVVTFPTKHFYVYDPSAGGLAPIAPFTSEWIGVDQPDGSRDPDLVLPCEVVTLEGIWDREEQSPGLVPGEPVPPIVSPAPPPIPNDPIVPFELCFETSVIRFGSADETMVEDPENEGEYLPFATEIFGSSNWHNIDNEALGFSAGWVRLGLDDYPHDQNGDGIVDGTEAALSRDPLGGLEGLPVTGFSANAFVNSFLGDGDVLANYGGLFQHKGTRKPSSAASSAPVQ